MRLVDKYIFNRLGGAIALLILAITLSLPSFAQSSLLERSQLGQKMERGIEKDELLPPHEAFDPQFFLDDLSAKRVNLIWDINPNYYLYKEKISLNILNEGVEILEADFPKGRNHSDEFFGEQEIYDHSFSMSLLLDGDLDEIGTLHFTIDGQGCAKSGFCYAPFSWEKRLTINPNIVRDEPLKAEAEKEIAPAPLGEHDRLTQYLMDHQYLALPLFFLLGLLLTFTPCVLPMLPILSGILTSQSKNGAPLSARQGFITSLVYVLAMSFVYTLLGVLAAHLGKGLSAYLQHPYFLTAFAIIFVLLALSMFDVYQLQMPSFIQNRLNRLSSEQQKEQSYKGVAIMGMLSALIVGPCVTAPLIGIIGLIAQTQNYLLGATALFSMSIGMGMPLLLLGASSGHILPKAGMWMNQVKTLFGFMLLGLAAYFFGRTLSNYWEQMLYALISLATAIWLIIYLANNQAGRLFFGALALLTLIFGIQSINEAQRPIDLPLFSEVKGINGLNQALANDSRITMLDFNADWCVACKEMEKHVFSQQEVQQSLAPIQLLMTDVTANDQADQQLLKHFNLYGPPAYLFFDKDGRELEGYRIVGSVSKAQFIEHIEHLLENHAP